MVTAIFEFDIADRTIKSSYAELSLDYLTCFKNDILFL